ncbi:MAG: hypothetical protein JSV51_00690 [Candidatus Bathyarchaeota archaeon]|nr:MAG: hypothetical protein JSV51_00690 [Candidatus Bathyarchaeota archaeon]
MSGQEKLTHEMQILVINLEKKMLPPIILAIVRTVRTTIVSFKPSTKFNRL